MVTCMDASLHKLETLITRDPTLLFTVISYATVLATYVNSIMIKSPLLGSVATILFFSINSVFLGCAIFKKDDAFFRLVFGILLLVMLLGSLNWIALITYNLDVPKSTLALLVTATISSVLNRKAKGKNAI
jgi:hypothetical protein